jgi:PIN domain nuclease of toxin-antitoxin system
VARRTHAVTALLLDTHAWIWLAAGDPRVSPHEKLLNRTAADGQLVIATVSLYEASLIGIETDSGQRRGRQAVRMRPTVQQWIRDTVRATRVLPVALDAEMATDAAAFHAMHPDPFDRMIVATAGHARARLATADAKIIEFARRAGVQLLEL